MTETSEHQEQTSSEQKKKLSITFTALIWTGILLALFGAVVAVLGLGGTTAFEGKIGDVEIKTASVGLAIFAVGAVLAGIIALRLPKEVGVLARKPRSLIEKIANRPIYFFIAGLVGCILLALSFLLK